MEIKHYRKAWLPAFKGGLLIIFGIIAMFQVTGTIKTLAVFFAALIIMIGILLILSTVLFGKYKFPAWTIISGIIHLVFAAILILKVEAPRDTILKIIILWVIYNALTELAEAGILISVRNAFAAVFVENALLSLLFGFALHRVLNDMTAEKVLNLGIVAIVFGLISISSAYLLNSVKENK